MPVFIAHRTADDTMASLISLRLSILGVPNFADHFDPQANAADDITDFLLRKINECTHMIAVVSPATAGSWWVPFEIGVATQGRRRITTYSRHGQGLPEFLHKWPILGSLNDLEQFSELYDAETAVDEVLFESTKTASARPILPGSPDRFHRALKAKLNQ